MVSCFIGRSQSRSLTVSETVGDLHSRCVTAIGDWRYKSWTTGSIHLHLATFVYRDHRIRQKQPYYRLSWWYRRGCRLGLDSP